jgi:hypothetical protein
MQYSVTLFISSFTDVFNERNEGSSDISSSRLGKSCRRAMRVPLTTKREEGAEKTDVKNTGASSNHIERNDTKNVHNVRNKTENTDATFFQSRFNTSLVGAESGRKSAELVNPVDNREEATEKSSGNTNSKSPCDIASDAVTSRGRSCLLSQKNKIQLYEWLAAYRDGKSKGEGNGRGKKTVRGGIVNQEYCRAYLTDEVIKSIIQVVPMNRDDLISITQCAETQDLLLESLSSFFKEYDLSHLFPTLNLHHIGATLLTVPPSEAEVVAVKGRSSEALGPPALAPGPDCGKSSSSSIGANRRSNNNSSSSSRTNSSAVNNNSRTNSNAVNNNNINNGDNHIRMSNNNSSSSSSSSSANVRGLTRSRTSVTADSSKRPAMNVFTCTTQGLSENTAKRRRLTDETQNRENVHINLREPYRPSIPMHVKGSALKGSSLSAASLSNAEANSILSSVPCAAAPGTLEMSNPLRRSSTAAHAPNGGVVAIKDPIQRRSSMSALQTSVLAGTRTGTVTDRERGTSFEVGTGAGRREVKCVEVVRKKSERKALPGHQCTECAAYYEALLQQGMVTETGMEEMLQMCSRHKVIVVQFSCYLRDDYLPSTFLACPYGSIK